MIEQYMRAVMPTSQGTISCEHTQLTSSCPPSPETAAVRQDGRWCRRGPVGVAYHRARVGNARPNCPPRKRPRDASQNMFAEQILRGFPESRTSHCRTYPPAAACAVAFARWAIEKGPLDHGHGQLAQKRVSNGHFSFAFFVLGLGTPYAIALASPMVLLCLKAAPRGVPTN